MTYAEERHARALLRDLERLPGVTASVEGAGVHWHCDARHGERSCRVNCFDDRGAEYLVAFDDAARGRTWLRGEAVRSIAHWLAGRALTELYEQFAFVDRDVRALTALAVQAERLYPALEATRDLRSDWADQYTLAFAAGDRSCHVSFYGDNERPDAAFHWDECELFAFPVADAEAFAAVVARWVVDRAMPSALREEFGWLTIEPLADAYESGSGVEGEFVRSWGHVEQFYRDIGEWPPVLALIAAIRAAGYDRRLRAGTSLYDLIVSRSRRYGLREGQPRVAFEFRGEGMEVYVGERRLSLPRVEFDPRVETLLRDLAAHPID